MDEYQVSLAEDIEGNNVALTPQNLFREEKIVGGIAISGPLRRVPDSHFLGNDFVFSNDHPQPYANHPWVYAAVRSISLNIASVPVKVERGSRDNPTEITEESMGKGADLLSVLNTPNKTMTCNQLMEATSVFLNLDGTCFWVLDRMNPTQVPEGIFPFGATNFEPVQDPDTRQLLGWMFKGEDGEWIPLTHDQVVVFRFFNPYDPVFGLAPIEAARRGVRLDFLANSYGQSFFENNADPSGILSYEKRLSPKQADEIIKMWEQRHRTANGAKKIGIVYGGGKYQQTAMSQRDMEFIKQREWNRNEILAVFKVPETEISMYQDVAHANAVSQDKAFWTKTLLPILDNISCTIEAQLVRSLRISVPGLRFFFDIDTIAALQETLNDKMENAERLYRIGYPINAINLRLKLGMPKVEWGDTWLGNSSLATVEDIVSGEARAKPSGPSNSGDPSSDPDSTPDDEGPSPDEEDNESPNEDRAVKAFLRVFSPLENVMLTKIKLYLWRLRSHQLKRIDRAKEGTLIKEEICFDREKWDQKLQTKTEDVYHDIVRALVSILDCGESFTFIGGKVVVLNECLEKAISKAISISSSKDEAKDKVRKIFNSVSSEEILARFCHIDTMQTVTAAYESFKRSPKCLTQ